jgi:hypothetical protein
MTDITRPNRGPKWLYLSDAYIFRSKLLALASVERDALEAFRREVVR